MKKLIILFTLIFCFGILNFTGSYASSLPIYDETYNNNQGAIYANGTTITVSEENGQTVVSWDGGSQVVPNTVSIFGGGNGGNFASSSITMNSGTVQNLIGGGIGFTEDTSAFVYNTKIVMNDGNVTNAIVGGGYFYATVDTSNIEVNGGSNGYTGNCTVKINGGSIYLYQSVNRGTVESAQVKLNSGSIDKFYVGGETEDSTVTGKIDTVNTNLIGGNIGSLNAGTSNSSVISIDNDNFKVVSTNEVKISDDTIENSKIKIDYDFDISDDNLVLFIDQSKKLDLNIKTVPENYEGIFDDVISYNCQNSDIAHVNDDGVVTGISKGNTIIEVKVGNKMKTVNVEVKGFGLLIIAGIAMLILYVVILFLIFGVYLPI